MGRSAAAGWLSIAVFLGLMCEPGAAQVEPSLKSPCSLNFGLLGGKRSGSMLDGIVFDTPPPQTVARLDLPHATTSAVVSQIPTSEESFKAVFARKAISAAEQREVASARSSITRPGADTAVRSFDDLDAFMTKTTAHNIIIAGHNDDGKFVFLNGSSAYIWNISKACADRNKTCIFVSCRSNDHVAAGAVGVSHDLTLREGLEIAYRIDAWLAVRHADVSDRELAQFVSRVDLKSYVTYHVSYIALKSCGAAGGGAAVFLLVEEKRPT